MRERCPLFAQLSPICSAKVSDVNSPTLEFHGPPATRMFVSLVAPSAKPGHFGDRRQEAGLLAYLAHNRPVIRANLGAERALVKLHQTSVHEKALDVWELPQV